jgi:3-deoxy-D-manno-octulosonic-acid transferase
MVPLDWTPFVRRRMDRLDPAALVLVETELWPALLREARRRGLPTGIVNGRVSDRTFSRYMALRPLFKPLLEVVRCVGARSSHDAAALAALGVPEGRILVTGNTKYELPQADPAPAPWIARPRWTALFVFGSLRSGELEHVRRALDALARDLPDPATALVLLAPRHPDRAARFVEAARALGLPVTLRSRIDSAVTPRPRGPFVVVVDTLGELRDLWPLATAGFVGGTLTPVGGHNLFEPAARGCPTLFGPSLETVADVASALLQTGGGRVVADGDRLGRTLCELAALPSEREEMSRRALEAAERLGGAAEATVGWLERWGLLPGAGDPVP